MVRFIVLLLCGMVAAAAHPIAQTSAVAIPDSALHVVVYVEVLPGARAAGNAALRRYRDTACAVDDCFRIELFEQSARPGGFVMIETWRDQKAFEAGAGALRAQLLDVLKPIRQSGWDERPYRQLTVAAAQPAAGRNVVSVVTHVDVSMDPKVPALLRRLAETSRQEAGNLRFDVLQHAVRANHFTIVETWSDDRARETHAAAAHTRQFRDDVQPMTGSPIDARLYTAIDR